MSQLLRASRRAAGSRRASPLSVKSSISARSARREWMRSPAVPELPSMNTLAICNTSQIFKLRFKPGGEAPPALVRRATHFSSDISW